MLYRGGDSLAVAESTDHRRTTFGLDNTQRWHFIDQTKLDHLFEAFGAADCPHPAANGLDKPIRGLPAKLLRDLKGHRFHALNGGDTLDAFIEIQPFAL